MRFVLTGRISAIALAAAVTLMGAPDVRAHPHVWVTTETTVLYENGTIVGLRQKWSFDDFYTSMALQGLDANNDGVYDRSELAELAKVNLEGLKEFDYFTNALLAGQKLKFDTPRDFFLEHADGPADQSQVIEMTDEEMDKQIAAEEAAKKPPAEPGMMTRAWNWMFGGSPDSTKSPEKDGAKSAAPPKVLSLHFTLPLAQPVLAEAEGFSFAIVDPSFFIAFEAAAKDPVVLGAGAPETCRVQSSENAAQAMPPPADTAPDSNPATNTAPPTDSNPAADLSRLGDAFAQQFGGPSVRIGRAFSVSCGPRS